MVDIKLIRSKLEVGSYVGLRDKREFIKWCIRAKVPNEKIIESFYKYEKLNPSQLEFMINDLRASVGS